MFAFNFGMNHRDESKCMFCVYYADKTERLFFIEKKRKSLEMFLYFLFNFTNSFIYFFDKCASDELRLSGVGSEM